MKRTRVIWLVAILAIIASNLQTAPVQAARSIEKAQTLYTWWLTRFSDGALLCVIDIKHEGPPSADEIEASCGRDLRVQWEATPPCPDGNSAACTGLHLSLATTPEASPTVKVDTATAAVTLSPTPTVEYSATPTSTSTPSVSSVREVNWLSQVDTTEELAMNQPLVFLAGHLIANGLADASDCPGGGLMANGAANPCGLERARYQVYLWQNRFDTQILNASKKTDVPPFVLKGVFTQETQFWPAMTRNNDWDFGEYGLGQLNDLGADTLLRWNNPFYRDLCPNALAEKNCKKEYMSLSPGERALLRGTVIYHVRADCPDCAYGIDLAKTESSVLIFAETLKANHSQAQQIVRNVAGWFGAFTVSREDIWRFTLTNYHAGPGCLYSALSKARLASEKLNWKKVSGHLEPGCQDAIDYIEAISTVYVSDPLPTPTITLPSATPTGLPTETPIPTVSPTETGTSSVSETPTATPDILISTATIDVQSPHEEGEIIVQMEPGSGSDVDALVESLPVPVKVSESLPELNAVVLEVAPSNLSQALAELQDHPDVASAEPNYVAKAAFVANDPGFYQQNNLWLVQAPVAWDLTSSSQEVMVAVIDTGVDVDHPDLADHIWRNEAEANGLSGVDDDNNGYVDDVWGWNMVAGTSDVNDDNGHGTHMAGIIGAVTNNAIGMAGIAPNARILIVKALDAQGVGSYAQIAAGIIYATDQGARIINLSLGGPGHSQTLLDAINYALERGVIIVAAAGNTGANTPVFPASYPGVLSVGGVDNGLTWAAFSTFGNVSIVAPAIDVYSTWPGGNYAQMSGTSVAAAEVSGVAALLAGQEQFTSAKYIRDALASTAFDLGMPGQDPYYGFGLVHAADALKYSEEGMPPVIWPTPGPSPTPDYGPGGVGILTLQNLWGATQSGYNCTLSSGANSLDYLFNDALASCDPFSVPARWTYTTIKQTSFTSITAATLQYRFYVSGWLNDTILLEYTNNNWVNTYVAETFNAGNPPPSTLTTMSYNVFANYSTPALVNAAQFRLRVPGITGTELDPTIFYVDEARLVISDNVATPTPVSTAALPARATTATPAANDPHVNYSATSDDCAGCHRSHTSSGINLRNAWPEENVCFTCHTAGGIGSNVQPAFTSYTNSATAFYKHDIASTNGVHRFGQNTGTSFGGANRHVECEDCHEPHEATRDGTAGTTKAPVIQPNMYSASGVDPAWSGIGAPTAYTWLDQAAREYQVCFKCHSSFTTLPTYVPAGWSNTLVPDGLRKLTNINIRQIPDTRDMAEAFNPYNLSFHPVVAMGRNPNAPAASFVSPWTAESMVYCTDCHSNPNPGTYQDGAHGSNLLHMLTGPSSAAVNYRTVDTAGTKSVNEVCFKCHATSVYGPWSAGTCDIRSTSTLFWTTSSSGLNLHCYRHGDFSCYDCHNSHGSQTYHLINFNSDASHVFISAPGRDSITAYEHTPTGGSCTVSCHGAGHIQTSYP